MPRVAKHPENKREVMRSNPIGGFSFVVELPSLLFFFFCLLFGRLCVAPQALQPPKPFQSRKVTLKLFDSKVAKMSSWHFAGDPESGLFSHVFFSFW